MNAAKENQGDTVPATKRPPERWNTSFTKVSGRMRSSTGFKRRSASQ